MPGDEFDVKASFARIKETYGEDLLDLEPYVAHLDDRRDILTTLGDAIADNPGIARGLFTDWVFGEVSWDRGLGRPVTEPVHDAFEISAHWLLIQAAVGQDGPVKRTSWEDGSTVKTWDAHTDERFRVRFSFRGNPPWPQGVGVVLKDRADWDPKPAPWMRVQIAIVYPPSMPVGIFQVPVGEVTSLDPITIVRSF